MALDREMTSLVRQHVRSVWALEMLLLMRGQSQRVWTEEELVAELRASAPLVRSNLVGFVKSGLVVEEEAGARFAPASAVLEDLCTRLAAAYRERPVAVINLIVSSNDRIQQLADAFRLRSSGS